jgi:dCTP deaminase
MVLTDREIQSSLKNKQIVITPIPDADAFSSTSLDLTLLDTLQVWKLAASDQIVCPMAQGFKVSNFISEFSDKKNMNGNGFVLNPGVFISAGPIRTLNCLYLHAWRRELKEKVH